MISSAHQTLKQLYKRKLFSILRTKGAGRRKYLEAFHELISGYVAAVVCVKKHEGLVHVVLLLYLALIHSSSQKFCIINTAQVTKVSILVVLHRMSLQKALRAVFIARELEFHSGGK